MHAIMVEGGLLEGLGGDPLLRLACHLAAICHDYQHKGVSNDFLITTQDELALLYNDKHPHENHHVAAAWQLTRLQVS